MINCRNFTVCVNLFTNLPELEDTLLFINLTNERNPAFRTIDVISSAVNASWICRNRFRYFHERFIRCWNTYLLCSLSLTECHKTIPGLLISDLFAFRTWGLNLRKVAIFGGLRKRWECLNRIWAFLSCLFCGPRSHREGCMQLQPPPPSAELEEIKYQPDEGPL